MKTGELERFLSDLQKNPELRRDFESLGNDPDLWVRWANERGYGFQRDEVGGLAASYDGEISDDELEKVAGGWCGNEMTTG